MDKNNYELKQTKASLGYRNFGLTYRGKINKLVPLEPMKDFGLFMSFYKNNQAIFFLTCNTSMYNFFI